MPRKKCSWYPGAKYHITSRGVRRTNLFHDREDREVYLAFLEETMKRYPFTLHCYCLMTNHIHLQIQTKSSPPGKIMKDINMRYARYFNQKYHHSGHVFDKRYGKEQVDTAEYELELSKYIHLNPLKANMVERIEDYPWSSYRAYVSQENSSLVDTKKILSYFPDPAHLNYQKYIESAYVDLRFSDSINIYKEMEEQL